MQPLLRLAALVFIVGLLPIGICVVPYACSPSNWLTESRPSEEFQHWQQAIGRYREGQFQSVQAWMDQRCTLAETLQWMQELDEEMEAAWPDYIRRIEEYSPISAEERHYQRILVHVQTVLRDRPEELAEVLRRLEKDSQRLPSGHSIPANRQR